MIFLCKGHTVIFLPSCCDTHDHLQLRITGFLTTVTRRVPLVEQKLLSVPEHLRINPNVSKASARPDLDTVEPPMPIGFGGPTILRM